MNQWSKIMRKILHIVFTLITVALFSQPLIANFNYQLNISSSYIWRGFDLIVPNIFVSDSKSILIPSIDLDSGVEIPLIFTSKSNFLP